MVAEVTYGDQKGSLFQREQILVKYITLTSLPCFIGFLINVLLCCAQTPQVSYMFCMDFLIPFQNKTSRTILMLDSVPK